MFRVHAQGQASDHNTAQPVSAISPSPSTSAARRGQRALARLPVISSHPSRIARLSDAPAIRMAARPHARRFTQDVAAAAKNSAREWVVAADRRTIVVLIRNGTSSPSSAGAGCCSWSLRYGCEQVRLVTIGRQSQISSHRRDRLSSTRHRPTTYCHVSRKVPADSAAVNNS